MRTPTDYNIFFFGKFDLKYAMLGKYDEGTSSVDFEYKSKTIELDSKTCPLPVYGPVIITYRGVRRR